MELLLFLLIIVLLMNSGDRNTARTGAQLLAGVATAFGLLIIGFLLFLGFQFFPTLTTWTLCALLAGAVALLIRWIYRRFFSPQARLNAAYERMHKRWYALSWHVVRLELNRYKPKDIPWAVEEGERILQRCREEHERYSKLPPQTGYSAYLTQFYIDDIPRLESRLRVFCAPK